MSGTGTATLDFGAFPGASDASVTVTGQSGILSGSFVEAWIFPAATADHTADEHWIESIKVVAGNIVAGTGFTIYGLNTNALTEPVLPQVQAGSRLGTAGAFVGPGRADSDTRGIGGGSGTRLYGTFNVAWVWN